MSSIQVTLTWSWGAILGVALLAHQSTDPAAELADARRHLEESRYEEAEGLARELLSQIDGVDRHSPAAAEILDVLNAARLRAGKFDETETEALLLRAYALRQELHGVQAPELRSSLLHLGQYRYRLGEFPEAHNLLSRAVAAHEAADAGRVDAVMALAVVEARMARYEEAESHYLEALEICRSVDPDSARQAAVLHNLGGLYLNTGAYDQARQALVEALELKRRKLGPEHYDLAFTLGGLGNHAFVTGSPAAAERYWLAALEIYERAHGADHPRLLNSLNNLGNAARRLGRLEDAEAYLLRGLGIARDRKEIDRSQVALLKQGLALLQVHQKKLAVAATTYREALALWESILGRSHPRVGNLLYSLGGLELHLGELAEARISLERAVEINRTRLDSVHPEVVRIYSRLAAVELRDGQRQRALSHANLAAKATLAHLHDTLSSLTEQEAIALRASRSGDIEGLLFAGLETSEEDREAWLETCWEWLLGARGIVLEELASRLRQQEKEAPALEATWRTLDEARQAVSKLWVHGPDTAAGDTFKAALKRARRRRDEAELRHAMALGRAGITPTRTEATLDELASLLPRGGAVVEVARVDTQIDPYGEPRVLDFALTVNAAGERSSVSLGAAGRTDALVAAWKEELELALPALAGTAGSDPTLREAEEAGRQLRTAVWDPILEVLGDPTLLFLVADGSLHQVSWVALPTAADRFLVEDGPTVHLLSSTRELKRLAEPPSGTASGWFVVGNPDFESPASPPASSVADTNLYRGRLPNCSVLADRRWAPLPASDREAREVAAFAEPAAEVDLLLGGAAHEEQVKRGAPGHRILHLATHGFFLGDACQPDEGAPLHPLLLSGLVFAGANRLGHPSAAGEDGVLTAEELAALPLHGTELAVLSACHTGAGTVAVGEGVFGLRRALELAGVRAVLMSLWKTPDRQTRRYMKAFYDARLKGKALPEAARLASGSVLEGLRRRGRPLHPYLWGGFVSAGDWR